LFAGALVTGLAAGVTAGLVTAGFVFAAFADGLAVAFAFVGAVFVATGAVFTFVFAGAGVDDDAPAGRAPLSSFGLSTTFFARKFSIFASFIAIA
jgi:hypothetical protein